MKGEKSQKSMGFTPKFFEMRRSYEKIVFCHVRGSGVVWVLRFSERGSVRMCSWWTNRHEPKQAIGER